MDTQIYQNYMNKKNTCQNLYNILNMTWYRKKYEHDTNTQIIRSTVHRVMHQFWGLL